MAPIRAIRRILTAATAALLVLTLGGSAGAVVPSWTTLVQGGLERRPFGIVARGDATFILIGEISSGGDQVCRLARLDAEGAVVWIRQVASALYLDCVGMARDDTGLYISFNAIGAVDGVAGGDGWDAYVRRLHFDASVIWTRSLSSSNFDRASSITAAAGNVVIGGERGYPFTPERSAEAFVRGYDVHGNVRWTRFVDSGNGDVATAVATDDTGTYAAVWQSGGGTTIHRFARDGRRGWTAPIDTGGRYAVVNSMAAADGRVFAVGSTDGVFPGGQSAGGVDAFVATFDPTTGAWGWVRQFGSAADDVGGGLAIGPVGVYVTGWTEGSLPRFETRGHVDAFVRSYTTAGRRRWTRQFGTHRNDQAFGAVADAGGVTTLGITDGNLGTEHVDGLATFARRWVPA